jgi:hypothetical protein
MGGDQGDPRGWIDPSRLHAALDVERKLPTLDPETGLELPKDAVVNRVEIND